MTPKPHRFLIERVSGYADEAGAFLRRRRLRSRSFARIWFSDGAIESPDMGTPAGKGLLEAAGELLGSDET